MDTNKVNQNEQTPELSEFLNEARQKAKELLDLVPVGSREVGIIVIAAENIDNGKKNNVTSVVAINGYGEGLKNGLRSALDNKEQPFKSLVLAAMKEELVERLITND